VKNKIVSKTFLNYCTNCPVKRLCGQILFALYRKIRVGRAVYKDPENHTFPVDIRDSRNYIIQIDKLPGYTNKCSIVLVSNFLGGSLYKEGMYLEENT
jgi:hypothetical protein